MVFHLPRENACNRSRGRGPQTKRVDTLENERICCKGLGKSNTNLNTSVDFRDKNRKFLLAEIEKLKKDLKEARRSKEFFHYKAGEKMEELNKAKLEIERLKTGNKMTKLTEEEKALRFDLDQAGIEQRDAMAVELVELKAELKELKDQMARTRTLLIQAQATSRADILEKKERLKQWSQMDEERNERGNWTSLAVALSRIESYGCEYHDTLDRSLLCPCLVCRCEEALYDLWKEREQLRTELAELQIAADLVASTAKLVG